MKSYNRYYGLVALSLALLASSCSQEHQEPQTNTTVQSTDAVPEDKGPTTTLNVNIEAGLEEESSRALNGLEIGADGKLFPSSLDGRVQAVVIIANASQVHHALVDMTYDATTRRAQYKGNIFNIPTSVLTGAPKAMVVVYPDGWYNASARTINMPEQLAAEPATGKPIDIKLPYFSDWQAITLSNNTLIPTDIKGLTFKPQGQILRLRVENKQTEMDNVRLHKFIFETNVMSRSGSYSLALRNSSESPSYTPAATERVVANTTYYRHDVKLSTAQTLDKSPKNYYLWVTARPNVATPYTRTLMSVQYMDPVLDPTSDNWWVGKTLSEAGSTDEYKVVAVGYNNSNLSKKGATYRLELNNRNGFTPITRFSFYYMSAKADQVSVNNGYGEVDTAPAFIQNFAQRFYPGHTRYTFGYLLNNGYLPTSTRAIGELTNLRSSQYKNNGEGLSWRIPNMPELRVLLFPYSRQLSPTGSRDIFAFKTANANKVATVNESVNLGGKGSASTTYSASYFNTTGNEIHGIRFMGTDNHQNKCWYGYRRIGGTDQQPDGTQIQARYLGEYYPEIATARDFVNFKGILPTIEERVIAWSKFFENNDGNIRGNYFWASSLINGNNYYRLKLDHNTGSVVEDGFTGTDHRGRTAAVILIRDFK